MKDSGIGSIDLIIILAYIIGILAIGLLSVRKKNDQHQLFFGRTKFQMANCRRCWVLRLLVIAKDGCGVILNGWCFYINSAGTYIRAVLFQNPNCYASSIPGKTIWTRIKNICCFYGNRYRWTKIGYVNRNGTNDYSYFRRCITYHFSHS